MAVDDDRRQRRLEMLHALGDLIGRQLLRLGVDEIDGQPLDAAEGRHQAGPHRVLDSRQLLAQALVHLATAAGIDQQQIQFS